MRIEKYIYDNVGDIATRHNVLVRKEHQVTDINVFGNWLINAVQGGDCGDYVEDYYVEIPSCETLSGHAEILTIMEIL